MRHVMPTVGAKYTAGGSRTNLEKKVSCTVLHDHNRGQGHVRSPGKKGQAKKNHDLELRYMFLGQIFAKNAKNDPKTLFEASKSVKK